MLEKLSPILPSRDIGVTEAFYGRFGFRTVYRDGDAYLLLERDGAEVHFEHAPALDPAANRSGAFLRPTDVDAFGAEVEALGLPAEGVPRFEPPKDQPWGMRECLLVDPDGNHLRAALELPTAPGA